MTFAVLGPYPQQVQFRVAIATSSIAIGERCPFVRAGVNAERYRPAPELHAHNLDAASSERMPEEK